MSTVNGLRAVHDTGAPGNSPDYTTLVMLHGYVWHSGIFSRLIPIAKNHNTRLILVDRRGYPESASYTDEERSMIPSLAADADENALADAKAKLGAFMKERARELFDFLRDLVWQGDIPVALPEKNAGGIVLAGWSLGALWMLAFLSHVSSFPADDVELPRYVRRIICYDAGVSVFGYKAPIPLHHPTYDSSASPEETAVLFDNWVSGYFVHGDTFETFAQSPVEHPPPTVSTMSPDERANTTYRAAAHIGAVDSLILSSGVRSGLFTALRQRVLFLSDERDPEDGGRPRGDGWRGVELRVIWCEQSISGVACAMMLLLSELEDARRRGVPVRNVRVVRVRNGNHFLHWDHPDWSMRALVGDEDEI